ncbi:GNAT family N-acetyltransferase [Actinomadura xylanilytica]|uniref:GNAT family N-acetyltransferase n=1 Tax=Actinomadura xylanilytica TaxID=887459 RepID=UPI00255ABE5B|nr:GNAT family N-acetyltransferase [Actinomadura xylanilytica]MDL4771547.1 GNAT family N-acetyltransferase [Actinomadura xylanilytica]
MGAVVRAVAWDHPAAARLRARLITELRERYADRLPSVPGRPLDPDPADGDVAYTGVAFTPGGLPVGHLALRWTGPDLELKRMYVDPGHRGHGVSSALLAAADEAARDLGAARIVLQTGDRQPEAVRLYERAGYTPIPVFPPYDRLSYSACFEKVIGAGR